MMINQNARLAFLRLIEKYDGQRGWYQFERAFPPGCFTDEPATKTAKQILDGLEADGLIESRTAGGRQKYCVTDVGSQWLRDAAVAATTV